MKKIKSVLMEETYWAINLLNLTKHKKLSIFICFLLYLLVVQFH